MDSEYILLHEAARMLGYAGASNLHKAVRTGRLKTVQQGPLGTRLTTRAWLEEYRQSLRAGGYRRRDANAANGHTIASLGWTRAEAGAIRDQLQSFAEDWNAPGMEA